MAVRLLVCGLLSFCLMVSGVCAEEAVSPYQFRLPSTDGDLVELFGDSEAQFAVVCFLGTECPLAKLYGPRLQKLAEQFSGQGVRFFGVDSNLQDSIEEIRQYAKQHKLEYPLLKDAGNKVADAYEVTRTSEVVVIDSLYRVRYRGRIDDQYQPGLVKPEPLRHDLKEALTELVAGKNVSIKQTEPVGCIIGRVPRHDAETEFTFAKDVSRLLQKHCVECHREGEIGPFALTDYDEVVGWGEMLVEVVDQGRMPPWHANPQHGHFLNAREMPDADKEILWSWVKGGMPLGDEADLPPAMPVASEWQLPRKPDLILPMNRKSFSVPAEGVVEYQYFVVDPQFEEDRWVTGVQVVPGNRSVVHHCIVFIRPPDGENQRGVGWIGGYVPGQEPFPLKPGYGRRIPAGSKLVFQMHYTPTGTPQEDLTKIGLIFGDEDEITHEVFTIIGINNSFEIPPNHPDFAVDGEISWLPSDGLLLGMTPHMHLRGKSFEVSVETLPEVDDPAEQEKLTEEILLDVPHYDFNWQHFYLLKDPLSLKNVNNILFTATFDNSAKNPVNPDPAEHVSWGDQTWQEMAIAFFAVARPLNSEGNAYVRTNHKSEESAISRADRQAQIDAFVDRFFEQFDGDGDGQIIPDEMPLAQKTFGFRRFDKDRDKRITREEVRRLAEADFRKK